MTVSYVGGCPPVCNSTAIIASSPALRNWSVTHIRSTARFSRPGSGTKPLSRSCPRETRTFGTYMRAGTTPTAPAVSHPQQRNSCRQIRISGAR